MLRIPKVEECQNRQKEMTFQVCEEDWFFERLSGEGTPCVISALGQIKTRLLPNPESVTSATSG